jgi:hypothetical protein
MLSESDSLFKEKREGIKKANNFAIPEARGRTLAYSGV